MSYEKCTAIGNSGHSLKQDCGIISTYLKGVSETLSLGFRVFDTCRVSTKNLVLILRNCGLNKRMHYTRNVQYFLNLRKSYLILLMSN